MTMGVAQLSKREQMRQQLTKDAIIHLAQANGGATLTDLMQIHEAVASTLIDRCFDDE